MKLDQLVDSEAQHLCIFGEPFTGKSTLAATCAELGFNVLWISLDKGHTVLRKLSDAGRGRVNLIRIPDTKDFPVGIQTCNKIMTGAPVNVCLVHGQVECSTCKQQKAELEVIHLSSLGLDTVIVFDHITQIADSAMAFVIKRAIQNGEKDATASVEKDPDVFKPGRDQFALQGFLMNKFLTNLQASRQNIIAIAHVAETEQEDGRKKLVPLIGTVPYSRNAPKYFDHIIYCEVSNKTHKSGSVTTYAANVISGSRVDVDISKYLVDGKPTLRPFFEHLIPRLGEKKDADSQPVVSEKQLEVPQLAEMAASLAGAAPNAELSKATVTAPATATTDAAISAQRSKDLLAKLRGG